MPQHCDFERPMVERIATEEEERGEVLGAGKERGNDRPGVVPLVVSAGLGVNVGVRLMGKGHREGEGGGGGETTTILAPTTSRGFLWTSRKDTNGGSCLVAWEKVMRPIDLGGPDI